MKKYTYYLTISILSLGILTTSCNSTGTNPNPINGTWKSITGNTEGYMQIDIPNYDTYIKEHEFSDCYLHVKREIHKLSDDKYVTSHTDSGQTHTDTVTIHVENNILIGTDKNGNTTKFKRSNIDLAQLELCGSEN